MFIKGLVVSWLHSFKLFFLLCLTFNLHAVDIDQNTTRFDLLSKSSIFIDTTNTMTYEQVREKEFIANNQKTLGFGFVENHALWIRFTLKNTSNKAIYKVLEYDNPETEDIYFYDKDKIIIDGMFHVKEDRKSTTPIFDIHLNPHEERVFYIKAHCKISTLIAKLTLWNESDFIHKSYLHQTYLFMFLAAIVILLIYNFMLLIFTRDKAYLYYVIYLCAVVFFESIYLGISQLYLFSNEVSILVTKATTAYISFLVIPIILFTRYFLNTSRFKKIDFTLSAYIYIIVLAAILSYDNLVFNLDIIAIFIPLGLFLVWVGFYTFYKGVKEAKFYMLGWSVLLIALVLSVVKSIGLFDLHIHFEYLNEVAFTLEALLFSIALAHRIRILSEEKTNADAKLIEYQRQESIKLIKLVDDKTKDLQETLEEKEFLYKELNHRVKNNLQMILSLVKLQVSKSKSIEIKEALELTKGRIHSIAYLYDILNIDNKAKRVDTKTYIINIVENLTYEKDIDFIYSIEYDLEIDKLIYCGLIINELVTNAMKYAFATSGEIKIKLYKEESVVYLVIQDNGVGFEEKSTNSLGLSIVNTLVEKQLYGSVNVESHNGTKISIEWDENESI